MVLCGVRLKVVITQQYGCGLGLKTVSRRSTASPRLKFPMSRSRLGLETACLIGLGLSLSTERLNLDKEGLVHIPGNIFVNLSVSI